LAEVRSGLKSWSLAVSWAELGRDEERGLGLADASEKAREAAEMEANLKVAAETLVGHTATVLSYIASASANKAWFCEALTSLWH
jgi:hypothetical protein